MARKIGKHQERAHALLSASGASRWMACTPSARLEDEMGVNTTSSFAKEGTLAHEFAEIMLKQELGTIDDATYQARVGELSNSEFYNDDMLDEVQKYVDIIVDDYKAYRTKTPDAAILIEEKVDFSKYVPEGFGSNDAMIIADDEMAVYDLKFGRGVVVSAENNKQMMLYALGAYLKYGWVYGIEQIRMSIIQPRINNYSTFVMSASDLMKWAETELTEKAALAYAGEGEFKVGDHCKFCKVKGRCRAFADDALAVARHDFKAPALLTDEEITEVLSKSGRIAEWASGVYEFAKSEALNKGKKWPGYKLVEAVTKRRWFTKNEEEIAQAIMEQRPELTDEDLYNMKLKPIGDFEKKFGKKEFAASFSHLVIKPAGEPVLAPDTDQRQEFSKLEQAQNEFTNN